MSQRGRWLGGTSAIMSWLRYVHLDLNVASAKVGYFWRGMLASFQLGTACWEINGCKVLRCNAM
eukprot:scaffold2349_cov140-Skeletonema_menzelii.AAC.1